MAEEPTDSMISNASLMDRVPRGLNEEDLLAIELPEEDILPDTETIEIITEENGDVVVDFDPTAEYGPPQEFYTNLAEDMDDSDLGSLSNQLMDEYESNKGSRKDWEEAYSKGLELLGFNYE